MRCERSSNWVATHPSGPPPTRTVQEEQRGFAVRALLKLGGYYSRESRYMRAAQHLYAAVTEQGANPAFLAGGCCWVLLFDMACVVGCSV